MNLQMELKGKKCEGEKVNQQYDVVLKTVTMYNVASWYY